MAKTKQAENSAENQAVTTGTEPSETVNDVAQAALNDTAAAADKPSTPTDEGTWLDRLKAESDELGERVVALTKFLNALGMQDPAPEAMPVVSDVERDMLTRQLDYMRRYSLVLQQRLALHNA